jgi:rhodanese-related sulfurtransferase
MFSDDGSDEGVTMFDVMCAGHGGPTIISSRSVVSVAQRDGVIVLHLRCWCGHLISHVTGRRHADEGVPAARPVSLVGSVPPARPARAERHFAGRLAVETDPSDVWNDLQRGAARFVLVDARSRQAFEQAHLPGAVSIPHAELDAASARAVLAEHGADLFVTYCWRTSCNAATKAAARLASFGLPVKEMIGGIEGWRAEGLPVVEETSSATSEEASSATSEEASSATSEATSSATSEATSSATSEEIVADQELVAASCAPELG